MLGKTRRDEPIKQFHFRNAEQLWQVTAAVKVCLSPYCILSTYRLRLKKPNPRIGQTLVNLREWQCF